MDDARPARCAGKPSVAVDPRQTLGFDAPIAASGYRWWYLDALSDDGHCGLTLIAFIGSVFSPYYAAARRRGPARPENFCAFNVALYSTSASGAARSRTPSRWAMTERGEKALAREADTLAIGPSRLDWDGQTLTATINEVTCPWPSRLRGTVRLHTEAIAQRVVQLDASGGHRWRPIAPSARVEVHLDAPGSRWSGLGYLDSNAGDEPLEDGFDGWHWSRAQILSRDKRYRSVGDAVVFYETTRRDGSESAFAFRFDATGRDHDVALPPTVRLPETGWRIARSTRGDASQPAAARVLRTLEDTPFYARSLLATQWEGVPVTAMHESLSLTRFRAPWVRALLPFRMPRRAWK
jgi:carotenoid 1,2-hydratase